MDKLKELRKEKKVTLMQMAQDLNVANNTISQWENGRRTPDAIMLSKLADYFDVTIDYLLDRSPIKKNTERTSDFIKEDSFEFALFGEVKDLSAEQKSLIIELARNMKKG